MSGIIKYMTIKSKLERMQMYIFANKEMLEKIKSCYLPTNLCVENLYVSICNALGKDYKKMYAYSWNFGYAEKASLYADKIKISRDRQAYNFEEDYALETLCGIKPIWHMNVNCQEFLSIIKRELIEGHPVLMGIDIYSCYWHKFFNNYHFLHFCLITGMDKEGLICIDDTLENCDGMYNLKEKVNRIHISFEQYKKYSSCFATFVFKEPKKNLEVSKIIYSSASKVLNGYEEKSDFDYMRIMTEDIEKQFDLGKESEYEQNPKAVRLIRSFATIGWSRVNYITFLNSVVVENQILITNISNSIKKSANLWDKISNYILLSLVVEKENFDPSQITRALEEVIILEESAAHTIVNEYKKGNLI